MRINRFDNRKSYYEQPKHTNKTYYRVLNDLGTTFGSIVDTFKLWLQNDMKSICTFKHTYIASEFTGMKNFMFTEGMLTSVAKPNLSLNFNIDHSYDSDIYKVARVSSYDSIHILKSTQFMESIIKALDGKESIDVKLAYKIVRINIGTGIVAQSRYYADNIAYAWNVKRQDGSLYTSNFLITFQIPDDVIEAIYVKFNIDRRTHRPMLRWLSKHCQMPVFFGVNTYNGKKQYFIKYKAKPLIRPTSLSSPSAIEENHIKEHWVLTRNFELDVAVPMILGITGYVHPEVVYDNTKSLSEDITEALRHEAIAEYSLQIGDKHAVGEFESIIEDDDIITLKNGKKISKKIDISDILETEGLIPLFREWGKKLGLTDFDLFEFVVAKDLAHTGYTKLGKGHTLNDALTKLGLSAKEYKNFITENEIPVKDDTGRLLTIDDLCIPNQDAEYNHYIKNSKEFWYIDLDPDKGQIHRITLYVSIRLFNQFILDTGYTLEDYANVDDMAHEYPQGKNKKINDVTNRY